MKSEQEIRDEVFARGLDAHGLACLDGLEAREEDEPQLTVDERAAILQQTQFLKGCILWASTVLIDQLFADLELDLPDEATDGAALGDLPEQYAHGYNPLFVRGFIVQTVDLLSGATQGWVRPKSVAQELALKMLLDRVEATAEIFSIELPEGWRGECIDTLGWEDEDVDLLYEPAADGIWNETGHGFAKMDFSSWFKPLEPSRDHLPPY